MELGQLSLNLPAEALRPLHAASHDTAGLPGSAQGAGAQGSGTAGLLTACGTDLPEEWEERIHFSQPQWAPYTGLRNQQYLRRDTSDDSPETSTQNQEVLLVALQTHLRTPTSLLYSNTQVTKQTVVFSGMILFFCSLMCLNQMALSSDIEQLHLHFCPVKLPWI